MDTIAKAIRRAEALRTSLYDLAQLLEFAQMEEGAARVWEAWDQQEDVILALKGAYLT